MLTSWTVPAVTVVPHLYPLQMIRPLFATHPPCFPHRGQTKPPGYRKRNRTSRHALSVENWVSNPRSARGYSSMSLSQKSLAIG